MSLSRNIRGYALGAEGLICLSVCMLACGFPILAVAQSQQAPSVEAEQSGLLDARGTGTTNGAQLLGRKFSGYISGTVIDQAGTAAVGAQVRLVREDQSPIQEVLSGDTGQFFFA